MTLPAMRTAPTCLAVLLTLGAACGGGPEQVAPGARSYEVRGVVTRVPETARVMPVLVIRHEAIDDFASIDGEEVGMDSMTMEIPVAEGLSLAGVDAGDKVAFTLEVSWTGEPPFRIVSIEELPADTELAFRKSRRGSALGGGASPAEPAEEPAATPAQDDAPNGETEEERDAETQG